MSWRENLVVVKERNLQTHLSTKTATLCNVEWFNLDVADWFDLEPGADFGENKNDCRRCCKTAKAERVIR